MNQNVSLNQFPFARMTEVIFTYAWGRASHEDQTAQIRGTLVAQCASGIDQSTDTI